VKILVVNGPNLNKLDLRDKTQYGSITLNDIEKLLIKNFPDINFHFFQTNIEGEIVDILQNADDKFEGILINPAAYSHTSVAIRDALEICKIPKVEVHLSNIANRDDFRKISLTAAKCDGYISGFKELSYVAGVFVLIKLILTN